MVEAEFYNCDYMQCSLGENDLYPSKDEYFIHQDVIEAGGLM